MKLFIDTNVWLRYLLRDDENAYQTCLKVFSWIAESKIRPYTSSLVLLEINFVTAKIYHASPSEVISTLEKVLKTRNLTLLEKTDFKKALAWHKKYQIKLADCLITSQLKNDIGICTFDSHFKKLPLKVIPPAAI